MRIKYHPATVVSIYVDGRVGVFHNDPCNRRDALKILMIKSAVRDCKEGIVEKLPPGDYRMYLTEFSWFRNRTKFDLKENV